MVSLLEQQLVALWLMNGTFPDASAAPQHLELSILSSSVLGSKVPPPPLADGMGVQPPIDLWSPTYSRGQHALPFSSAVQGG